MSQIVVIPNNPYWDYNMDMEFESLVVHAGIEPEAETGAVMTPIYQTSTFAQSAPGVHKGFEYARTDNPTRSVLQKQLAALESADRALVFASGMAAIDAVFNLLQSGDHVVGCDDLYGGTRRLLSRVASQRGIESNFVDFSDFESMEASIRPSTRILWFETPTNPTLKVIDIAKVVAFAKQRGIATVVDNTFMSPYLQRPLELGVDIVMHSMTKSINGHSDVVMGSLMFRNSSDDCLPRQEGMALGARLKFLQNSIGAVPGPFDCWLVLRGIKTLAVRMQRIDENARSIAAWLEGHPRVEAVLYPGLASHLGHGIASKQASGFGGMLSFRIRGGLVDAVAFLSKLKMFAVAESLGGVESLAEHPAIMTHASVPIEVREAIGISDNLIRLSIGIESVNDLRADLDQALSS